MKAPACSCGGRLDQVEADKYQCSSCGKVHHLVDRPADPTDKRLDIEKTRRELEKVEEEIYWLNLSIVGPAARYMRFLSIGGIIMSVFGMVYDLFRGGHGNSNMSLLVASAAVFLVCTLILKAQRWEKENRIDDLKIKRRYLRMKLKAYKSKKA